MATSSGVRALRLHERGKLSLDYIPQRPCGAHEVRLKIAYCGICGSDIHEFQSAPIFSPAPKTCNAYTGTTMPIVMGHEMSGTVVEVGAEVSLQVGQEVCVNPSLDDRHYGLEPCHSCQHGKTNICSRWATFGLNAEGGGFADEIVVRDINCVVLPVAVSLKVGALCEPLAVAWHSIRTSGFAAGMTAVILGAGPIGLAILLLLRKWEAKKVLVTEVATQRIEQAKRFGADQVFNPLEGTNLVLNATKEWNGEGADVVFDCTGLQSTLDTGIAALKPGGTFFNVAIHEGPLMLNLNDIACKEKKLAGGICYTQEDFQRVLETMAEGDIPFEEMITSVVSLEHVVQGGFLELMENRAKHVKILIEP